MDEAVVGIAAPRKTLRRARIDNFTRRFLSRSRFSLTQARRSTVAAPRFRLGAWAAADAIGHCVLVFAFLPALAVLPGWLYSEATNPLNASDAGVLAFVPVRGFKALLDAFYAGVIPGVSSGLLNGLVMAVWLGRRLSSATTAERMALGALGGAVAGSVTVLGVLAVQYYRSGEIVAPPVAIAFEVASAAICGVVAAPGAVRLLGGASIGRGAEIQAPRARVSGRR